MVYLPQAKLPATRRLNDADPRDQDYFALHLHYLGQWTPPDIPSYPTTMAATQSTVRPTVSSRLPHMGVLSFVSDSHQLPQPKGVRYIDPDIASPSGSETPPAFPPVNAEPAEYYGGTQVYSRARTLSTVGCFDVSWH